MSVRFHRHELVPEWRQQALAQTAIVVLPGDSSDPVANRFLVLAAAVGFRKVYVAGESGDGFERALRLDPGCSLLGASVELAAAEIENHVRARQRVFVAAHNTRLPGLRRAHYPLARVYSLGSTGALVADASVQAKPSRLASESHVGAHLAAASLLASALEAAGVMEPPARLLPKAPAREVFTVEAAGPARWTRGLRLLVVGGGGALSHAFLEALLIDDVLRTPFERVCIVDPDIVEESNLSRQTLYSTASIGRGKANSTCSALEHLWPVPQPRLFAHARAFDPAMVAAERPDVVVLAADNFAARAQAWRAVRDGGLDETLVVCAGTAFLHGQLRALLAGKACLDCGPERLRDAEAEERAAQAHRASCTAAPMPANVLTNAIAGALAASEVRTWLLTGRTAEHLTFVNAYLPARYCAGGSVGPCECRDMSPSARGAA